ncbi:hypothetical protein BDW22DRAFT_1468157 [Trametopsis cervina]|nr:hypothetical protein BDW22DRAFT_1468157 [Trametopsis cervina]
MCKALSLKQLKLFRKSQRQHQIISYPQPPDTDIVSSHPLVCTVTVPEEQEAADTEEIVSDIPQENAVLCTELDQWAIWELEGYAESRLNITDNSFEEWRTSAHLYLDRLLRLELDAIFQGWATYGQEQAGMLTYRDNERMAYNRSDMRWTTLMEEHRVLGHNMEEISDWAKVLHDKQTGQGRPNMSPPSCKGFFPPKRPDTPPDTGAATCQVYMQSFMEDLCETVANLPPMDKPQNIGLPSQTQPSKKSQKQKRRRQRKAQQKALERKRPTFEEIIRKQAALRSCKCARTHAMSDGCIPRQIKSSCTCECTNPPQQEGGSTLKHSFQPSVASTQDSGSSHEVSKKRGNQIKRPTAETANQDRSGHRTKEEYTENTIESENERLQDALLLLGLRVPQSRPPGKSGADRSFSSTTPPPPLPAADNTHTTPEELPRSPRNTKESSGSLQTQTKPPKNVQDQKLTCGSGLPPPHPVVAAAHPPSPEHRPKDTSKTGEWSADPKETHGSLSIHSPNLQAGQEAGGALNTGEYPLLRRSPGTATEVSSKDIKDEPTQTQSPISTPSPDFPSLASTMPPFRNSEWLALHRLVDNPSSRFLRTNEKVFIQFVGTIHEESLTTVGNIGALDENLKLWLATVEFNTFIDAFRAAKKSCLVWDGIRHGGGEMFVEFARDQTLVTPDELTLPHDVRATVGWRRPWAKIYVLNEGDIPDYQIKLVSVYAFVITYRGISPSEHPWGWGPLAIAGNDASCFDFTPHTSIHSSSNSGSNASLGGHSPASNEERSDNEEQVEGGKRIATDASANFASAALTSSPTSSVSAASLSPSTPSSIPSLDPLDDDDDDDDLYYPAQHEVSISRAHTDRGQHAAQGGTNDGGLNNTAHLLSSPSALVVPPPTPNATATTTASSTRAISTRGTCAHPIPVNGYEPQRTGHAVEYDGEGEDRSVEGPRVDLPASSAIPAAPIASPTINATSSDAALALSTWLADLLSTGTAAALAASPAPSPALTRMPLSVFNSNHTPSARISGPNFDNAATAAGHHSENEHPAPTDAEASLQLSWTPLAPSTNPPSPTQARAPVSAFPINNVAPSARHPGADAGSHLVLAKSPSSDSIHLRPAWTTLTPVRTPSEDIEDNINKDQLMSEADSDTSSILDPFDVDLTRPVDPRRLSYIAEVLVLDDNRVLDAYTSDDTDLLEEIVQVCRAAQISGGTLLLARPQTNNPEDHHHEDHDDEDMALTSLSSSPRSHSPVTVSDLPDDLAYPYDGPLDTYPTVHAVVVASGSRSSPSRADSNMSIDGLEVSQFETSPHGQATAVTPAASQRQFLSALLGLRDNVVAKYDSALDTILRGRYAICNKAGVQVRRARNLGLDRWLATQDGANNSDTHRALLTRHALFDLKFGSAGNPLLFPVEEREISQALNFFRQRRDPRLALELECLQAILDFRLPTEITEHITRLRDAGALGGTWVIPGDCPMLPAGRQLLGTLCARFLAYNKIPSQLNSEVCCKTDESVTWCNFGLVKNDEDTTPLLWTPEMDVLCNDPEDDEVVICLDGDEVHSAWKKESWTNSMEGHLQASVETLMAWKMKTQDKPQEKFIKIHKIQHKSRKITEKPQINSEAYTMYKRVDRKVKPVPAVFPEDARAATCQVYMQSFMEDLCETVANLPPMDKPQNIGLPSQTQPSKKSQKQKRRRQRKVQQKALERKRPTFEEIIRKQAALRSCKCARTHAMSDGCIPRQIKSSCTCECTNPPQQEEGSTLKHSFQPSVASTQDSGSSHEVSKKRGNQIKRPTAETANQDRSGHRIKEECTENTIESENKRLQEAMLLLGLRVPQPRPPGNSGADRSISSTPPPPPLPAADSIHTTPGGLPRSPRNTKEASGSLQTKTKPPKHVQDQKLTCGSGLPPPHPVAAAAHPPSLEQGSDNTSKIGEQSADTTEPHGSSPIHSPNIHAGQEAGGALNTGAHHLLMQSPGNTSGVRNEHIKDGRTLPSSSIPSPSLKFPPSDSPMPPLRNSEWLALHRLVDNPASRVLRTNERVFIQLIGTLDENLPVSALPEGFADDQRRVSLATVQFDSFEDAFRAAQNSQLVWSAIQHHGGEVFVELSSGRTLVTPYELDMPRGVRAVVGWRRPGAELFIIGDPNIDGLQISLINVFSFVVTYRGISPSEHPWGWGPLAVAGNDRTCLDLTPHSSVHSPASLSLASSDEGDGHPNNDNRGRKEGEDEQGERDKRSEQGESAAKNDKTFGAHLVAFTGASANFASDALDLSPTSSISISSSSPSTPPSLPALESPNNDNHQHLPSYHEVSTAHLNSDPNNYPERGGMKDEGLQGTSKCAYLCGLNAAHLFCPSSASSSSSIPPNSPVTTHAAVPQALHGPLDLPLAPCATQCASVGTREHPLDVDAFCRDDTKPNNDPAARSLKEDKGLQGTSKYAFLFHPHAAYPFVLLSETLASASDSTAHAQAHGSTTDAHASFAAPAAPILTNPAADAACIDAATALSTWLADFFSAGNASTATVPSSAPSNIIPPPPTHARALVSVFNNDGAPSACTSGSTPNNAAAAPSTAPKADQPAVHLIYATSPEAEPSVHPTWTPLTPRTTPAPSAHASDSQDDLITDNGSEISDNYDPMDVDLTRPVDPRRLSYIAEVLVLDDNRVLDAYTSDETDLLEEIVQVCRAAQISGGTLLLARPQAHNPQDHHDEDMDLTSLSSSRRSYSPDSVSDIPDDLAYPYDGPLDTYPAVHAVVVADRSHSSPSRADSNMSVDQVDFAQLQTLPLGHDHSTAVASATAQHHFASSLLGLRDNIIARFDGALDILLRGRYAICNKAGIQVRRARNLGLDRWLATQDNGNTSTSRTAMLMRHTLFDLKFSSAGNPLLFPVEEREISQALNFFRQRRDPRLTSELEGLQAILDFRLPTEITEHITRLRDAGALGGTWVIPGDCPMLPAGGRMY